MYVWMYALLCLIYGFVQKKQKKKQKQIENGEKNKKQKVKTGKNKAILLCFIVFCFASF